MPEEREEKIRLGGMALRNGVLVHGPTSWACAIRLRDGTIKTASARKRTFGVDAPLLRGPARLLEALAVLPDVKRKLPEAKLPFERPGILAAMGVSAAAVRVVRDSKLTPAAQELASGLLALAPALVSLRSSDLAAYHGAEHISIGSYEHDEPRAKEHERCGSHLIGPMIATQAAAQTIASKAPERYRNVARAFASLAALGASTEMFAWMVRNPERKLSRALAKPGHTLQHNIATAEPTPEQVVDRPRDAVALRLTGDHDGVEREQLLDERLVPRLDDVAVGVLRHLWPDRGVVLGARARSLHLERRLALARDRVEEDSFLDRGDERVPDPAQHRVVRPDRQLVLAALGKTAHVVQEMPLTLVCADAESTSRIRVETPTAALDVVDGDDGVRRRRIAFRVHEPQRVEDLRRLVRVERREDLGHGVDVAVEELAEAAVVVDGSSSRAAAHEQFEFRNAERVLHVDEHERDAEVVVRSRTERVLPRPFRRGHRALLVRNTPHRADVRGVEVRRNRQHSRRV